jgi:hypothetical protein
MLLAIILASLMPSVQDRSVIGDWMFYHTVVQHLLPYVHEPRNHVSLRVISGEEREFQVRWSATLTGAGTELEIWFLPPDAAPISQQIEKLAAKDSSLTVEEAVKAIAIRRRPFTLPPSHSLIVLLNRVNSLSVPLVFDNVMTIDAPLFELVFKSGSRTMNLTVSGANRLPPNVDPLYEWLVQVETEIRQFLRSQTAAP